jgi:hypothetical protein
MWLAQMWTFRAVDRVVMALLKALDRSWCRCGWTDFVIPSSGEPRPARLRVT